MCLQQPCTSASQNPFKALFDLAQAVKAQQRNQRSLSLSHSRACHKFSEERSQIVYSSHVHTPFRGHANLCTTLP